MSIYLYGLQRSGTNIIHDFLHDNFGLKVHNSQDRKSPGHKHFRIYDDKTVIPETDVPQQYSNAIIVKDLNDLDSALNDQSHTNKYIVVYKDIFSWLPSIESWAKTCKWKTANKMDFIDDYVLFIEKWKSIANERVLFLSYDEFLSMKTTDDSSFIEKCETFLEKKLINSIVLRDKTSCSSTFTKSKSDYYTNKEYMQKYTPEQIETINSRIKK